VATAWSSARLFDSPRSAARRCSNCVFVLQAASYSATCSRVILTIPPNRRQARDPSAIRFLTVLGVQCQYSATISAVFRSRSIAAKHEKRAALLPPLIANASINYAAIAEDAKNPTGNTTSALRSNATVTPVMVRLRPLATIENSTSRRPSLSFPVMR
jgi:hypothetical protein